jgi:hypothetical protein
MPEAPPRTAPVIAMAMFVSVITLVALSVLIFSCVVPIADEVLLIA